MDKKPGIAYIITNEGLEGLVKIGMVESTDPNSIKRRISHFQAGSPYPYFAAYAAWSTDVRASEADLHMIQKASRVKRDGGGDEWFRMTVDSAKKMLDLLQGLEPIPVDDLRSALAAPQKRNPSLLPAPSPEPQPEPFDPDREDELITQAMSPRRKARSSRRKAPHARTPGDATDAVVAEIMAFLREGDWVDDTLLTDAVQGTLAVRQQRDPATYARVEEKVVMARVMAELAADPGDAILELSPKMTSRYWPR